MTQLAVEIKITEDLILNPGSPPIGFQLNGYSQKKDTTISWQQSVVNMSPGSNQLTLVAEDWPESLNTNPKNSERVRTQFRE